MTTDGSSKRILNDLAEALVRSAGYRPDAVVRDYAFADYLGADQVVRQVELAAFGEIPPSYRSACLAAARVSGPRALQTTLQELKALGAPRVITLGPLRAQVWHLSGAGEPVQVNDLRSDELTRLIRTSAADWTPQAMSRLGGLAAPGPYQLDFADLGLVPMIERQVNEKIDRLIQEVLTYCLDSDPGLASSPHRYRHLVRTIFQLLAAKVLADREHPSLQQPLADAAEALKAAQQHYGLGEGQVTRQTKPSAAVLDRAWEKIQNGFHFQNLSVDSLAFVYENSLVSPEIRRRLGIHGTPRGLAELVTGLLAIENLPSDRTVILEPCSGFAPFLLAAMRRLRAHGLSGLDPSERHTRLVHRLRGLELDTFAVEVGRLCLTLADYPNADGWELFAEDVFQHGVLEKHSSEVGAVLANPPFEAFNNEEKERYDVVRSEKPAELLRRVLDVCSPLLLGFVVPRIFVDSNRSGYRELRESLRRTYREVDLIDVPDRFFGHSEAESALLITRDRRDGRTTKLRTTRIRPAEKEALFEGRWQPEWSTATTTEASDERGSLRVAALADVWDRLAQFPKLSDIATVRRGFQYKSPLVEVESGATSETPRPGFALGVREARDIQPYRIAREVYLNVNRGGLRRAADHPWSKPKVIVNAARRQRGPWPLTAALDLEGRWCYQNFFGVWPGVEDEWGIAFIAAVLNGPIGNAFVATGSGKRHIHRETLASIPTPQVSLLDKSRIIELVNLIRTTPELDAFLHLDAEVLRGYGLPPRLERQVLRLFEDQPRPGVPGFHGYYPPGFDSALPLHQVISGWK